MQIAMLEKLEPRTYVTLYFRYFDCKYSGLQFKSYF